MKMKKLKSIKTQMLFVTSMIAVLLTAGILTSVSVILSSQYDKEIKTRNETLTQLISSNLESFLDTAYKLTEELTENSDVLSMDEKRIEPVLKSCVGRNSFIELLFEQRLDGMQIARSSGECGDRSQRFWFEDVHKKGRNFISSSYLSATSGYPVTSVFFPLKKEGKIIGSLGMDIKLDYLQELILKNADEANGKYSFIIDGDGVIIAHPNKEQIEQSYNYKTMTRQVLVMDSNGKPVIAEDGSNKVEEENFELSDGYKEIINNVMSGKSGSLYFKEDGNGFYGTYTPIKISGDSPQWSVITIQTESAAKAIITYILKVSISAGIVMILIAFVLIFLLARRIANPIIEIANLLSKTADGDFTVSFHSRSKNEIGLLADKFNEMVNNVSNLLSSTINITENINTSITILSDKSSNATQVADSIKDSVNEILEGSVEQASDATESAAMSSELDRQFENLSSKTTGMIEDAREALEITTDGSKRVDELKEKNQMTSSMIGKTAEVINNLHEQSKNIGSILNTLEDISSQTNLLSLNASIEAARAGENGKSFAVVAQEIQKLSVASSESTKNIEDIITEIQDEISSSVKMMNSVKDVSVKQQEVFKSVETVFDKITETTKGITTFITEIADFVEEMKQSNNNVVASITNISAISEETAACTESVTKSVLDQNAEIAQIAAQAEELKEKSAALENEISKFIIEARKTDEQ